MLKDESPQLTPPRLPWWAHIGIAVAAIVGVPALAYGLYAASGWAVSLLP